MLFDSLVSALWLTGMGLQIVLGVVLIAKKSWRKFPVFTAFCIVSMISDVGLYALIKSSVGPVPDMNVLVMRTSAPAVT